MPWYSTAIAVPGVYLPLTIACETWGMLDEEAAFLKAIAHNPEDDTSRLVYADWLDEDEQYDPVRAELIRLQCGLEGGRIGKTAENPKASVLRN